MDENLIRFDKKSKILFIDFETENLCLNYQFNKPWQMAMLLTQGEDEIWAKDIRINFDNINFSQSARSLAHSFSEEKQKNGLTPVSAANLLKDSLNECDYLAGHNIIGFDIFIVKALFDHAKIKFDNFPKIIDTLALFKGIRAGIPYQAGDNLFFYQIKIINEKIKGSKSKLSDVAAYFGIEFDNSKLHDALYDLKINFKIWNKLKFQVNF